MQKQFSSYLRTHRRRYGLTQDELAVLVGAKSGATISRLERSGLKPTFAIAIACQVLFDAPPAKIFPGHFASIEDEVITRAYNQYEILQGRQTTSTKIKLDFFERAFARATARLATQIL